MSRFIVALFLFIAANETGAQTVPEATVPPQGPIDLAFRRMYNFDFAGAHAILDEEIRNHPEVPLTHSVRAALLLFTEFDRLKILETDFFADDDQVTNKKKLKPEPAARTRIFAETSEARTWASARLAVDAQDRDALLAMCMAAGVETDYTSLVEKKYLRSYSLSKEDLRYAQKLLALKPPVMDAYLTLGSVEYAVGSLNFFFRIFIRFDQIQGNKQKGIENLMKVVEGGRYYPPFAKILLSVIYLRENRLSQALALMKEVERDFPENPLFRKEVIRISERISRTSK